MNTPPMGILLNSALICKGLGDFDLCWKELGAHSL